MASPGEEVARLKGEVEEKTVLLNKLKARAKDFVNKSNTEKKQLQTEILSLKDQLKSKAETEVLLGSRVAELGAKCAELESGGGGGGGKEAKETIQRLTGRCEALMAQLTTSKNEMVELEKQISAGENRGEVQVGALRQKLSNAEHDRDRAENMKRKVKEELKIAIAQRTGLEEENNSLKSRVDALKAGAKDRKRTTKAFVDELNARLEKTEEALRGKERDLAECLSSNASQKDALGALSTQLEEERSKAESVEEKCAELDAQIESIRLSHESLSKEKEKSSLETKEAIAKKELELQSHKKKRLTAKSEIVNIAKSLEKHQDVLKSTVHAMRTLISPRASEQVLSLKSLQGKVDDLIKRVEPTYIIPNTPASPKHGKPHTTGFGADSSASLGKTGKSNFLQEPSEVLSGVESELQAAISAVNLLESKISRLVHALDNEGGGGGSAATPGSRRRRGSGLMTRASNNNSCLSRLCPKFISDYSNYSKVTDDF
jgi:chromosome segregation ATPase